ncbi:MAG TPA: hypothetical protein VLX90_21370, partial [Steroidobacteraceae bacterium]|nr:hypothetical protein [Steroidobacteraceae bacterium]
MNTRSLSFRLVAWYAGLLTIAFVLLGGLTVVLLRHYLESALLDTQVRRARQIADTLMAAVARTGETAIPGEVEDLYSPEANDRFIRISRPDGTVLYASGRPRDGSFEPVAVPAAAASRDPVLVRKEDLRTGSLLIGAVRYPAGDRSHYLVEVGVSTERTDQTVQQVLRLLAIALPILVCVAVSGGFVLVRRALKPV